MRATGLVLLPVLAAAGPVGAQSGSCAARPPGIVSWWAGETDTLDSAASNHGTAIGGLTFAAGKVGQAFQLDGIDDYIDIGNPAGLNPPQLQSFTMVAWVKRAGPSSGQY